MFSTCHELFDDESDFGDEPFPDVFPVLGGWCHHGVKGVDGQLGRLEVVVNLLGDSRGLGVDEPNLENKSTYIHF